MVLHIAFYFNILNKYETCLVKYSFPIVNTNQKVG